MIFRALKGENPPFTWEFGKGKQSYDINVQAVKTNIKTRLYSFKNDCFFDSDSGIDWFTILGNPNNRARILLEVNNTLLNSYGVQKIISSDVIIDSRSRKVTLNYEVKIVDDIISDEVTL